MSSTYIQCKIDSTDEILIAFLSEYEFESFEEVGASTVAYIKKENLSDATKSEIEKLILERNSSFEWSVLEDKNWNEIWESNFNPIKIGNDIVVRADFHQRPEEIQYDLVINPKMAFGTGHHATTYMMLEKMLTLDMKGKTIFDYGCGTGILAIFASMLGAVKITAVDIEKESYNNTVENALINHVKNICAFEGTIAVSKDQKYDVVLANINRNVLLETAEMLSANVENNGILLLSGILLQDFDIIHHTYLDLGFKFIGKSEREGWLCLEYKKLL